MDEKELSFLDKITAPLTGDYRKKKPISVKAADVAVDMTPVGSAVEIGEELSKEDPSYGKVAIIAAGDALGAAIPAMGPVAKSLIKQSDKIPTKMLSNVEYDARVAELDEALTADEWKRKAKALVEEGRVVDPQVRTPELEESARDLINNKITREEHLQKIDEFKPVDAWDDLPREPSDKATVFALNNKQQTDGNFVLSNADELGVKKANLKIGDRFLGRLDIPAYKDFDTWIITGTTPKGDRGSTYAKAIHYEARDGKPVILRAAQAKGEEIGKGETGKIGYAVVDGNVKDLDVDAIRAKAAEYLNDPEWTQVGFDPRRQAGFYVRAGENKHVPVREATEVIQIGPLVLAKNAKLDFDHKGYREGGMALEEQMAMNFGKVPDNTIGQDPVSGNDIPMGSTAENVRDDIPSMLSEGEIVVPADVVNFHGVKLFEDLRAEAKIGYAQMANDGRIGGQPMDDTVDMGMDISLTLEDLETSDDAEPVQMDEGGLVEDEDTNLIGGEAQFNEGPYYSQKGGFDMDNAFASPSEDVAGSPVLEMREYMNDDGHRIFITFIDGVPQMEIPEGYYPVEGEGTVVATNPPVGGSGGSDMGDSGSGTDMPTPEAVNYKELSMEELSQLIEDQKSLGSKFVKTINPLIRIAMWDQTRRTKNEIERRLSDPATSEVDKIRLRNLLEIANRDEPGLIKSLLDKVRGTTLETAAGQIPQPKKPDVDFDDPTEAGTVAAAYTPNDQEQESTTTPGVSTFDDETRTKIRQASADAATIAFGSPPKTVKPVGNEKFIQAVKDDPVSFLPPTPTPSGGQDNNPNRPEPSVPSREEQMLVQGINKGARVTKKRKKKKSK